MEDLRTTFTLEARILPRRPKHHGTKSWQNSPDVLPQYHQKRWGTTARDLHWKPTLTKKKLGPTLKLPPRKQKREHPHWKKQITEQVISCHSKKWKQQRGKERLDKGTKTKPNPRNGAAQPTARDVQQVCHCLPKDRSKRLWLHFWEPNCKQQGCSRRHTSQGLQAITEPNWLENSSTTAQTCKTPVEWIWTLSSSMISGPEREGN